MRRRSQADEPVVLAGDFNVVPTDFDIYNPKSFKNDALLQPRAAPHIERLLAQGWTDAIRTLHPEKPMYTFWDFFRDHWARDAGLRIDHLLLNGGLVPRLRAAGVDRWVRGQQGASDHAPAWIEIDPEELSSKIVYACWFFPATNQSPRYSDGFALRSDTALMQNRRPLGGGPSGNTWPKCASQTLQVVSTRCMP